VTVSRQVATIDGKRWKLRRVAGLSDAATPAV